MVSDDFLANSLLRDDFAKYAKIFRYVVELSYRLIIFRSRFLVYVYVNDEVYKQ